MKTMKILFAALAVAFISAGANAQTIDEVQAKYEEATGLVTAKKFADAIPALNQTMDMAEKVGPDAAELLTAVHKLLPTCYFYAGGTEAGAKNFEKALEYFGKAEETAELYGDPKIYNSSKGMIAKVYTVMAADAFNKEDYAKAAEIYAKGYAANPKDTNLGLNLAMSYCKMGEMDKGIQIYKDIIALGSNAKYAEAAKTAKEDAVKFLLADAVQMAKDNKLQEALAESDKIIEIDPSNAQAHIFRLQTATNMKDYDAVISYGDAAIAAQTTPEQKSDANFLVGAAYQNKENKAKAIEYYRKVTAGNYVSTAKAQITALNK